MEFWHNISQPIKGKMYHKSKDYQARIHAVDQDQVQKYIKFSMAELSGRILRQKDLTRLHKGPKKNQGGKLIGGNFLPAVFIDSVKKLDKTGCHLPQITGLYCVTILQLLFQTFAWDGARNPTRKHCSKTRR